MRTSFPGFILIFLLIIVFSGCNSSSKVNESLPERSLSENFKNYWFNGEAEITSYELVQSRYGEPRPGTAVLIFVTEDFLKEEQVKANQKSNTTIPVLKLNATKSFTTGIYPYSIMQNIFYPLEGTSHATKITASIQEWCGMVYMQLNNTNVYDIRSHSYFEGEADQFPSLPKSHLENEVWTQLRIDPNLLPTGEIQMIPAFEFIRLAHIEINAYRAMAEFYQDGALSVYQLSYPELNRELRIYYEPNFPFKIEKWVEITESNGKELVTTATKMSEIKSAYWNKNSNKDLPLRDKLNLD